MNRHSLITITTLFYFVIILSINLLLSLQYREQQRQENHREVRRYFDIILGPMHEHKMPPPHDFRPPDNPLEGFEKRLPRYGLTLTPLKLDTIRKGKRIEESPNHVLYELNGTRYFAFFRFDTKEWFVIEDSNSHAADKIVWIIVFTGVNTLLLFFYLFLYKKLTLLHKLKIDIQRFAEGKTDIDTTMQGKDEISEVANAFNQAIVRIRSLQESRNLFLRNVMHELKTPIAKGKITIDMFEPSKYRDRLVKSFERLEFLLSEFAKIERITSGHFQLKRHPFRLMDVLDHAIDILNIDPSLLDIESDGSSLDVDFELFAAAVKNLIDNALRYGSGRPKIVIKEKTVQIISEGAPLAKAFETYLKPFSRAYESSAGLGLDLGLYIISNIVKAHHLTLTHRYDEAGHRHYFVIR